MGTPSMNHSIVLSDTTARQMAVKFIFDAPEGYECKIAPRKRSGAENRLLHAMLTHISKYQEWAGKKRDVETWKRLLIAAWCRATGEPVELLPALDGMGVDIVFRRSSNLNRKECAELIEFVMSWAAENDVRFPAREIEC